MAKHMVVKALLACNSALILLVILLLRKLREKASLNVFIDELGRCRRSTSTTNWTLKLVFSSSQYRKELPLASSELATVDATEKLEIAVKSKLGTIQIRGHTGAVEVDYVSGYVCLNCHLFRRTAIGVWRHMPQIVNATRHHISLFSFRGYVGIAAMDAVKRDLEQLLPASFVVGEPLANDGLPGFQTAMRLTFDGDVLDTLRAYAQANAHLLSWHRYTEDGDKLHICL